MTPRFSHNPPSDKSKDVNVEDAKERFRLALGKLSIAESISEPVRQHPWGSVIGTCAGAFALAALVGGDSKDKDSSKPKDPEPKPSHSSGLMSGVFGLGLQLAQAYLAKSAAKEAQKETYEEYERETANAVE